MNASFEQLPDGFPTNLCGGACAYTQNVAIPGWNAAGGGPFGQLIMGGYAGNPGATDGIVMAYSQGGTLTQDVGTAVNGTTYTLSVDLLHRYDAGFAGYIALLIGGAPVAGTISGSDPGDGNWGTFTETYTATGMDDGQTITIQLNSSGSQGDYDNVSLDATPEPATIVLFGSAFAGMALLRRKRVG